LIVAIDTNILIYFLEKDAPAPKDPNSGLVVEKGHERIAQLVTDIERLKGRIIVPTPVLAEVLVEAGSAAGEWLAIMKKATVFKIAEFDERSAFEFSLIHKQSLKTRMPNTEKRRIKFDDQIFAIAKVNNASILYSDDNKIKARSTDNLRIIGLSEMPLPKSASQLSLDFTNEKLLE
jgi:predicted nucleic acid-binding protein